MIKHFFVSQIADGSDDTIVRPSDWNASHVITPDLISSVLSDHNKEKHDILGIDATTLAGRSAATFENSGSVSTHSLITSNVHNFDSSGNAPSQVHGSGKHTGTIGTPSQVGLSNVPNLDTTNAIANSPSSDQKNALSGSCGIPSLINPYVTLQDTNFQHTITGAASSVVSNNLSGSVVVVSDSNGKLISSATSTVTLGYLDASSSIQTQLNSKAADSSVFHKSIANEISVLTHKSILSGSEYILIEDNVSGTKEYVTSDDIANLAKIDMCQIVLNAQVYGG